MPLPAAGQSFTATNGQCAGYCQHGGLPCFTGRREHLGPGAIGMRQRGVIGMTTDAGVIGKMTVAVVGAGLIGRSWSIVFARAGYRVALYDADADALARSIGSIESELTDLARAGLLDDEPVTVRVRIALAATLSDSRWRGLCARVYRRRPRCQEDLVRRVGPDSGVIGHSCQLDVDDSDL